MFLQEHGGAVDVAVGANFCMALTRNGSVIAWGDVPADPDSKETFASIIVGKEEGLPRMSHIAAGATFGLMSDGERVWVMGSMLRPDRNKPQQAAAMSWRKPHPLPFEVRLALSIPSSCELCFQHFCVGLVDELS